MAAARGDYYIIDRDERGIGGELVRVATLHSWKEAKEAWGNTLPHSNDQVVMFFARVTKQSSGGEGVDTLDCK